MAHTDELQTQIEALENLLIQQETLLSQITQTRSFFRDGIERTVTIAPASDIVNQENKIIATRQQIIQLNAEIISEEIETQTMELPTEITPIMDVIPITEETILVTQPKNNTLRNALIIGGLILLV